jgi:ectoine hydroxylase-related dioxygenase (phytanoyl-CoA dioxygenase family)
MSRQMLTSNYVDQFHTSGYCVLDNIISDYQADAIIKASQCLAGQLLREKLNSAMSPLSKVDIHKSNFLQLVRSSRADAGNVFDALIKIPLVNQILYSKTLEDIASQLLGSDMVLAPPSQMNLRADHPDEEKFLYPWHTDFSYNGSSSNSLVFWIPLQDVDLVNGALHIIPGSHRFRSIIKYDEAAIKSKISSGYFSIENIDEALKNFGEKRCLLRLGQAVVFHSKLLHKSGVNLSKDTRFALQSRWFDGLYPDAVRWKFRGGLDEGVHPSNYL